MEVKSLHKVTLLLNKNFHLNIEVSKEKIQRISAEAKKHSLCLDSKDITNSKELPELLKLCANELDQYFKKEKKSFSFIDKLDLQGTPFQKRIFTELIKIPWGDTINYEELAMKVGSPRASRAAGSACGSNRFIIVVPCHRVISKSGTLGGFSSDINLKRTLLDLEGGSKTLKKIFI